MKKITVALFPEQRIMGKKREGWENAVSFPFARDIGVMPIITGGSELLPCTEDKPLEWYLRQVNPEYLLMPLGEAAREAAGHEAQDDGLGIYILARRGEAGFFPTAPYGASVLCHAEVLEEVSAELGGGFFILPSSVHEVIIVPESLISSEDDMIRFSEMIKTVNTNEISPEDFLSNHLYYYNDKTGKITVAVE